MPKTTSVFQLQDQGKLQLPASWRSACSQFSESRKYILAYRLTGAGCSCLQTRVTRLLLRKLVNGKKKKTFRSRLAVENSCCPQTSQMPMATELVRKQRLGAGLAVRLEVAGSKAGSGVCTVGRLGVRSDLTVRLFFCLSVRRLMFVVT
jgi:hypothetical protein